MLSGSIFFAPLLSARCSCGSDAYGHSQVVRILMDSQKNIAWERVKDVLDREKTPFTQNTHYLQVSRSKFLSMYKKARADPEDISGVPPLKRRKTDGGPPNGVPTKDGNAAETISAPAQELRSPKSRHEFGVSSLKHAIGTPAIPPPSPQMPTPQPSFEDGPFSIPLKRPRMDEEERAAQEQEALTALTVLLGCNISAEDLAKLLPPDPFEEELEVMAEIRAYFKVAYKVCIILLDSVPPG